MFWLYEVIIRGLYIKEGITDSDNLMILYPNKEYWIERAGKCENLLDLRNFSALAKKKTRNVYQTKLLAVTKFVKQRIPVFVKPI
jgi:hypothetical protein